MPDFKICINIFLGIKQFLFRVETQLIIITKIADIFVFTTNTKKFISKINKIYYCFKYNYFIITLEYTMHHSML